jgi:hypothetical protein
VSAEQQLQAIADATQALGRADIPHWLYGGWAEDFYAGEIQRPHKDVDLVVWAHDAPEASAALEGSGFVAGTDITLERNGVTIDLHRVETDLAGNLSGGGAGTSWPPGALGSEQSTLDGVTCRVVDRSALRDRG